MLSRSPLPPGLGVEIDRAVRLADEGHVLLGGCPPRAVRLTPGQVSSVIRWLSGADPIGRAERVLARSLIEAGLAHPRPTGSVGTDTVDVAVVGRAGPTGLAATLDGIALHHPHVRPVVVGATGDAAGVALVRGARLVPGPAEGPGARLVALRACTAEYVALIEAGTYPGAGWLDAALGHFADPGVAAVLPRVLTDRPRFPTHTEMTVAAVAAIGAGADRGADPAPVLPWGHGTRHRSRPSTSNEHAGRGPLRPVPVLVVRRAVADLDPGLGAGAELDLLWRLSEDGWSVRYEPRSRVWARPITDMGGYLRACFTAGAVAGPLARRHGRRAAGPELSWAGAAGLGLVVLRRPGAALAAGVLGGAAAVRVLSREAGVPLPDAMRSAGSDVAHTAGTGVRTVRDTWWPVAAGIVVAGAVAERRRRNGARARCSGSLGRPGPLAPLGLPGRPELLGLGVLGPRPGRLAWAAAATLVLPHVASWHRGRGTALVGPVTWTALGVAGDAARSLGTWWGMARSGSVAPLVPRLRPVAVPEPAPHGRASGPSRELDTARRAALTSVTHS